MLINFNEIEETVTPNFKGGEGQFAAKAQDDGLNRIMRGRLEPGCSIGMHTHDTGSEIIFVVSGNGKVICDGKEERLFPGACSYCPKGHSHTLINDTDESLVFCAVIPKQ